MLLLCACASSGTTGAASATSLQKEAELRLLRRDERAQDHGGEGVGRRLRLRRASHRPNLATKVKEHRVRVIGKHALQLARAQLPVAIRVVLEPQRL
eukprot:6186141-Pleurochrysis_carterae.AAC.1